MSDPKKILDRARDAKNDEYYTFYNDIERGISPLAENLKNKIVYCPCDNPEKSNFIKYFIENFERFGLRELWATWYGSQDQFIYNGKEKRLVPLVGDSLIGEDGRFQSTACRRIMEKSDVVITNPPFSLFRLFYKQLKNLKKDFVLVAPFLALGYSDTHEDSYARRLNYIVPVEKFYKPDGTSCHIGACFLSSFIADVLPFYYTGVKSKDRSFQKYANTNAVNIDSIRDIPDDYFGVMGVPINFFNHMNRNQFELLQIRAGDDDKDLALFVESDNKNTLFEKKGRKRKRTFTRILIKRIKK